MIRDGGGGFEAFVFIDPGDRDLEAVIVGTGDERPLFEVPEGEFEVFAGHAETVFEVKDRHRGGGGFKEAAVIESGEQEVAFPAFSGGGRGAGVIRTGRDREALAMEVTVLEVVSGAAFGIEEDVLSGGQRVKDLGVAGFEIVRVVALGEEAVDPVDGVRVGFGVNLEEFVVVSGGLFDRRGGGRRGWRFLEMKPEAETVAPGPGRFTGEDGGLRRKGA
jgi:hypothetical protein